MTMTIKTMSVSETGPAMNAAFEKLGWNTWPAGTVVSTDICTPRNNGGWKCLEDFQNARMKMARNCPSEKAELMPNGVRIIGTKIYGLRTIQEVTITED